MPKKNTFISELKSIIASSNYSFNDVPEEVIPVFVSFFEALTDFSSTDILSFQSENSRLRLPIFSFEKSAMSLSVVW